MAVGDLTHNFNQKLDSRKYRHQPFRDLAGKGRRTCKKLAHVASPLFTASYPRPKNLESSTEKHLIRHVHTRRTSCPNRTSHTITYMTPDVARSSPAENLTWRCGFDFSR